MLFAVAFVAFFAVQCFPSTSAATTKKMSSDAPIVYPGPFKDNKLDDDLPEECRSKTFCHIKPANYPQEEFNKMFKGRKRIGIPTMVVEKFGNRQGDPDEKDDCKSVVTYEPIYKAQTVEGEWRTVVQAPDEDYVQAVRLETCLESENTNGCFQIFPPMTGYETFCKQKYNEWELLVAKKGGGTELKKVRLPVCCSCHYKSV